MKENQSIEFKENWRDDNLKTISGFANSKGGTMYIGINDSGDIIGISNISKLLEDLPNKISNRLGILPEVCQETQNDIDYIAISIASSNYPISYEGKYYKRSGSTTQELKGVELQNFLLSKTGKSWDSLMTDATIDDLDIETLELFKRLSKERLPYINQSIDYKLILENLNLIVDNKLTNAAVLLFGKKTQKFITNSEVRVGRFKNQIDIIDTMLIHGNLFQQLIQTTESIKKHLNVKFEINGNQRQDIWDYPIPALREAVMNSLIHKDYQVSGDIQIRVYDDSIWFFNTGLLPYPMTIDKIKLEHGSFPRNKLLAMIFYYAGFIEKWGSGILRIISLCKSHQLPEPDFKEEMGGFSVLFYKEYFTESKLLALGLNERMRKAILYVKDNGRITNKEYQLIGNCGRNTASIELRELVENKFLVKSGKKGAGTYYSIAQ